MSGNSAKAGNDEGYARALADFRTTLEHARVVSAPMTAAELYELERLIGKYPAEARELLARHDQEMGPDAVPSP
jgi:hypothetical protein